MSYDPICSDSRWATEILCRDAYARNTQNLESGLRGWVQVTDVPGFLGVALVVLYSSPGQVIVVSYMHCLLYINQLRISREG